MNIVGGLLLSILVLAGGYLSSTMFLYNALYYEYMSFQRRFNPLSSGKGLVYNEESCHHRISKSSFPC